MAKSPTISFEYTDEARARISRLEIDNLLSFFEETSREAVMFAVSSLPNAPGFRTNSARGIERQIQMLSERLTGKSPQKKNQISRDFDVLGFVWMSWGTEYLGDGEVIRNYIENDRENVKERPSDETTTDVPDASAVDLFDKINDLTHQNKCVRAQVRRFFEFSPFSEGEHIRSLIESCKPAADVEHDKQIAALPSEVVRVEREIEELSISLTQLNQKVDENSGSISTLLEKIKGLTNAQGDLSTKFKVDMDDTLAVIAQHESQSKEFNNSVNAAHLSLRKSVEALEKEYRQSAKLLSEIILEREHTDNEMEKLQADLVQYEISLSELSRKIDQDASLDPEERNEADPSPGSSNGSANITIGRHGHFDPEEVHLHKTSRDILKTLIANFANLNIQKSSAETLAIECLAALAAGQLIQFTGLNGKRIAEACAISLSANNTYILTVPVGLIEPTEFRRKLWSLVSLENESVGCVVIDGLNRSALDAFGEALVDLISKQRSNTSGFHSPLLLATCTDGPASLPISPNHISLGPVFDTDALGWRTRYVESSQGHSGELRFDAWKSISDDLQRTDPDNEEVLRLLEAITPNPNPLLKNSVISGFYTLAALEELKTDVTTLQSLAFGWLIPLCIAMNTPLETVDNEFDGGRVDGDIPDRRLMNIFSSDTFKGSSGHEF